MNHNEQIGRLRYYFGNKTRITIFANGTAIVSAELADAKAIMEAYKVPHDGEGHMSGDMTPLEMDDGNLMVLFRAPSEWLDDVVPQGQAVRVVAPYEFETLSAQAVPSQTEVFARGEDGEDDPKLLPRICLAARNARTRDAYGLTVVATWPPTTVPETA